MNEIQFTIDDSHIDKMEAQVYLNVHSLLSEMLVKDVVSFVLEYEDHEVLLKEIGIGACKDYFDLTEQALVSPPQKGQDNE